MTFSTSITTIIRQRRSVRTYTATPIAADKETLLKQCIAENLTAPFQTPMRFQVIAAHPGDADALKGLGTYGVIKHPQGFLVGATTPAAKDMEDFGYVMEKLILYATDLGLGTCWLGGSFKQSNFAKAMAVTPQESVPAVISLGYAAEKPRLLERFVRFVAKPHLRLPWEQLFFVKNFSQSLTQDKAGAYSAPLEMVRVAPSASNFQPWRIIKDVEKNIFHFYLTRKKGYNRSDKQYFKMADLQRADMGIAMCHFEMTAQELGLNGAWKIANPGIASLPEMTEYSVSWIGM